MNKRFVLVGVAVLALGGMLWAGTRRSTPRQPMGQHVLPSVLPPPLPKPAPDASTTFTSETPDTQANNPPPSAPSEHAAADDPFQQGGGLIGVKDAFNAMQRGIDRDDVQKLLGTPSVSRQIAHPSLSDGEHTNAGSPDLPTGSKGSGSILDMEYQYPDGKLRIYLVGTKDGSPKRTGGSGTVFTVYKFWMVH